MTDTTTFVYHQPFLIKIDGMDGDITYGPGDTCNSIFHALSNGAKDISVKACYSEQQKEEKHVERT